MLVSLRTMRTHDEASVDLQQKHDLACMFLTLPEQQRALFERFSRKDTKYLSDLMGVTTPSVSITPEVRRQLGSAVAEHFQAGPAERTYLPEFDAARLKVPVLRNGRVVEFLDVVLDGEFEYRGVCTVPADVTPRNGRMLSGKIKLGGKDIDWREEECEWEAANDRGRSVYKKWDMDVRLVVQVRIQKPPLSDILRRLSLCREYVTHDKNRLAWLLVTDYDVTEEERRIFEASFLYHVKLGPKFNAYAEAQRAAPAAKPGFEL